ncbi:MAG: hypothetical protein L6408_03980 [Nanoarchaeota archaeon]|nr:hypothetical protein [Nanoarchaeota archaeon]
MKFKYSNLIYKLKPEILIQILKDCGINEIYLEKKIFTPHIKKKDPSNFYLDYTKKLRAKHESYQKYLEDVHNKRIIPKSKSYNAVKGYLVSKFYTLNLDDLDKLHLDFTSTPYLLEEEGHIYSQLQIEVIMCLTDRIALTKDLKIIEKSNKNEVISNFNSLFCLNKLENHTLNLINEIKNSDLRNYTSVHSTEIFKDEVIFKIYRGTEASKLLVNESLALNALQKRFTRWRESFGIPKIYCYGQLNDFYTLIMEKVDGITADKFFKKIKDSKTKKRILKNFIEHLADIHIEGKDLETTYGTLNESSCLDWLKTGFWDRIENKQLNLESLLELYKPIAKQLADYKIKVFNKDANLKNWIIKKDASCYAIDFENTGLRPPQLDLVQLLENEVLNLSESDKEELKKHYVNIFNKKANPNFQKIENYKEFDRVYNCASLHRNLVYSGFSSEKFKNKNPKKSKHLQLRSLEFSLNSLKYLIKEEPIDRDRYLRLYTAIKGLKEDIIQSS